MGKKIFPTIRPSSLITHHSSQITGVVLAAGAGRRMGRPKLLLPYRGRPLLEWTLELVEGLPLERRLIVLGAQAEEILRRFFRYPSSVIRDPSPITHNPSPITHHPSRVARHGVPWEVLLNEGWEEGMGSSLRLAARHVDDGMLLFLGDMPEVPEEAALAVLKEAGGRPVAPSYRGRRGFPVYLPPSLRPRLLELSGDIGARGLIEDGCELIPCDDPGVVRDVDVEEDLKCARPDRLKS